MNNVKCPFCGSEDVVVDVAINVCAKVVNGKLELITDISDVKEAVSMASSGDMKGFCKHCGEEFIKVDFDNDNIVLLKERVNYVSMNTWE